jgi:DNA-binding CsgD family transcriptional regulator
VPLTALIDDDDLPAVATADRLSPREREVSRQISRALSISEKTVGSHVDHIMTKLGLSPSGPD